MNDKIDIVIPWVDGSDSNWLEEKEKWEKKLNPDKDANSVNRYQSWDNLQYLFRAIERFMPWFNNIYFVTCGHIPDFLNIDHPQLKIINHSEFIPERYLPTFNINTIELNLHRIRGLSDNFVYFNDDTFPLTPIDEEYYFINNLPCDEAIESPIIPVNFGEIARYSWNMRALNISLINKHFCKREVINRNPEKWFFNGYGELVERNKCCDYWNRFVGFRDPHVPIAFKKKSFETVWKEEADALERTCMSKFRNYECVNHWLVRYWRLCEGNFVPRMTAGKSYTVTIENYEQIAEAIESQAHQMICINEDCSFDEFEIIKERVNSAFGLLLPQKSSFEK